MKLGVHNSYNLELLAKTMLSCNICNNPSVIYKYQKLPLKTKSKVLQI